VLLSAVLGILLVVGTLAGYGKFLADTFAANDVAAGMYDGFARYRMSNVPTVVYGTGFLLALISVPRERRWCSRRWTFLAWITLLPMLIAVILSGRRAAWLVVLLSPFIVLSLLLAARQPLRLRLWLALLGLGIAAGVGVLAYFDLEASSIAREFVHAFDFTAEKSASVRGTQGEALFAGWAARPVLGHGLGAAASVIRSLDTPWAYELSYAALLFQTGIVGIAIYGAAILWVFWAGIRIVRKLPESATVLLPLLAGLAGFLIANGTNPYLAKFDYLWVIFLPIAAINVFLAHLRATAQADSFGHEQ
jgi:O-antigen ligase